jgi:hypothetical protein
MNNSQGRHFTKVYQRARRPLAFLPFVKALDDVIVSDVSFALTGKRPPDVSEEKRIDSVDHILSDVIHEHKNNA